MDIGTHIGTHIHMYGLPWRLRWSRICLHAGDPGLITGWEGSLGEDPLEKGMATHSGILAWRIPWTEEPGGLQSMGSQRVGQN